MDLKYWLVKVDFKKKNQIFNTKSWNVKLDNKALDTGECNAFELALSYISQLLVDNELVETRG